MFSLYQTRDVSVTFADRCCRRLHALRFVRMPSPSSRSPGDRPSWRRSGQVQSMIVGADNLRPYYTHLAASPSRECCFVSYTERSMETVHCRIATQPDRAQPLSTRPHTPSTLALLRSHNCNASRFRLHLHDTCLIATALDARHCCSRHALSLSMVQMERVCFRRRNELLRPSFVRNLWSLGNEC